MSNFYVITGDWNCSDGDIKSLKEIAISMESLGYILRSGVEKEIEIEVLSSVMRKEVHPIKKERGFFSDRIFERALKSVTDCLLMDAREKWRSAHIVGMMIGRNNPDYKVINTNSDLIIGSFQDGDGFLECSFRNKLMFFNINDKDDMRMLTTFKKIRRDEMGEDKYYALLGPSKMDDPNKKRVRAITSFLNKDGWVSRMSKQKILLDNTDIKSFRKSFIFTEEETEDIRLFYWQDSSGTAEKIASKSIKNFDGKGDRAKRILEINSYKVLGPVEKWKNYSKFILIWGDGEDTPTKHAVDIARKHKIKVFNMDTKGDMPKLQKFIKEISI